MIRYNDFELKQIKSLKDLKRDRKVVTEDLFAIYETTTKATHTEIVFVYNKMVYAIKLKNITVEMVTLGTNSTGGLQLRLNISKAQKQQWLISGKARKIVEEEKFLEEVKASKYNKGEIAEKIMTERRGMVWTKDNVRYDKAGDVDLKRDRIQIKFQNASLTRASTIVRVVSGN